MPTSSGQKLPEGYTGKWEASSYYFYLETKGYDPQWVYHGDETNLPDEDVPTKVYADLGAPRVHVRTSGQDKDNKTAFLVQNTFGGKLPLYPILRGDNQANRPGFHTKKTTQQFANDSKPRSTSLWMQGKKAKAYGKDSSSGLMVLLIWMRKHFYIGVVLYGSTELAPVGRCSPPQFFC